MRKIILSNLISLDGFFEGPDKELDWFVTDDDFMKFAGEQLTETDTIIFGRVTYQMMAAYWPNVIDNDPLITEKMNSLEKIVFSKTLDHVEWNNSRLINEITTEEINKLKQQPGKDMVIFGSGEVVTSLMQLNLIDEYRIILNPVVLGDGNPLFKGLRAKHEFKLVNTKTLASGVVILYYQPLKK